MMKGNKILLKGSKKIIKKSKKNVEGIMTPQGHRKLYSWRGGLKIC